MRATKRETKPKAGENVHQSEPPDKVNAFMFNSTEQKVKEQKDGHHGDNVQSHQRWWPHAKIVFNIVAIIPQFSACRAAHHDSHQTAEMVDKIQR